MGKCDCHEYRKKGKMADQLDQFADEVAPESTGEALSDQQSLCLKSFQIIASVGEARSSFIKAIGAAKAGDFDEAEQLMQAGKNLYVEGHAVHASMLQETASGVSLPIDLILIHAEDQLMGTESFEFMARELIDVYKRVTAA